MSYPPSIPPQQGSTLLIALLLLTTMSILGLGAMQAAQLEEKMVSNHRFGTEAFYAAEAGISQAINNHRNNQVQPSLNGTLGNSEYQTTTTASNDQYTITSTGHHPASGSQQTVTAVIQGQPGTAATHYSWQADE